MRARRVRGKSSEEAEEENSPLVTQGYRESGFYPKGKEKLLKGFVQEQGTDVFVQSSVCGFERSRHYEKEFRLLLNMEPKQSMLLYQLKGASPMSLYF